jgi:hypothetical protein
MYNIVTFLPLEDVFLERAQGSTCQHEQKCACLNLSIVDKTFSGSIYNIIIAKETSNIKSL